MSTGLTMLAAFGLLNLAICVWCGRGLLEEVRARRALTRRRGLVERVESRSRGQSWTDYRAIVRYEDAQGRAKQLATAWSETPFSVGSAVVVGEDPASHRAPRLLTRRLLAHHLLRTLIPGGIAVGVLLVLVRVGR